MTMTHGGLFAGIGGIDLGFERAGIETIWQVENDDYATKVLEKHWPNVRRWADIRTFPPDATWPTPDIISGGFPCQDLSTAGKRAGLSGARSGLWAEMLRVIRRFRPRIVFVENVPNLLSGERGEWASTFFGTLAESGYDCEWDCIPAAAVGAPHLRYRVFVVAYARQIRCNAGRSKPLYRSRQNGEAQSMADAEEQSVRPGLCSDQSAGNGQRRLGNGNCALADAAGEQVGATRQPREGSAGSAWWSVEPDVGRVADGVPKRVDRLRCLGNAVVPQVAEWIGRRIMDADSGVISRRAEWRPMRP